MNHSANRTLAMIKQQANIPWKRKGSGYSNKNMHVPKNRLIKIADFRDNISAWQCKIHQTKTKKKNHHQRQLKLDKLEIENTQKMSLSTVPHQWKHWHNFNKQTFPNSSTAITPISHTYTEQCELHLRIYHTHSRCDSYLGARVKHLPNIRSHGILDILKRAMVPRRMPWVSTIRLRRRLYTNHPQ